MLKNAMNFLGEVAATVNGSNGDEADYSPTSNDHIVGSVVDVGGIQVRVRRRIGEGGFAFVYAVEQSDDGRPMALKRLLAADAEKRKQTVQEITFLKKLKPCPRMMQYIAAANLPAGRGLSATKCEEFLLLTELCVASLYNYLSTRAQPFPPQTVAQIFFQTLDAVAYLHRQSPPIVHRDLKCENLLVDSAGGVKLCDLGSATTALYAPDAGWNMARRTAMEEELQKYTTPMYRSPEMVDIWSNYAVGCPGDVWALGCLLYQLCFHRQAFDDGAKLSIINGNFSIPETDVTHVMFHDLIRQTLAVDPEFRPSCGQIQEHLGDIGVTAGWDLEAKIDFELNRAPPQTTRVQEQGQDALTSISDAQTPSTRATTAASTPSEEPSSTNNAAAAASASNIMSNIKGGAGSMFGRIRESSKAVVNSLLATKDLDLHLLTSRVAGMSCPTDGMDLSSNGKNSIEDIRQILEARHAGHYAVFNLCEKKYAAARFPNGRVVDVGWTAHIAPSLEELLDVAMRALEFLGSNKQNVIAVHCLDGRSNTALLFAAVLMVCKVFSGHEDCLNLFELKRCEPVLTGGQRAVLKQLERVLKHGPSVQVSQQEVTINSVIMEPVPLYTKANDGVRPFVEVYSGSKLAATSFKDYGSLKLYTPYDVDVVMETSLKVMGDLTVVLYHGRQSLGTFFAGKLEKIRICQVSFNPAAVSTSRNHVRFPTHELDCIGDVEKIPGDFTVTVNFTRSEGGPAKRTFPYKLPERRKLDLIFGSKSEFNEAVQLVTGEAEVGGGPGGPEDERPPDRPERGKKSRSPLLDMGAPAGTNSTAAPLPPPAGNSSVLLDFGAATTANGTNSGEVTPAGDDFSSSSGGGKDAQLLDIGLGAPDGTRGIGIGPPLDHIPTPPRQPSPNLARGDSVFGAAAPSSGLEGDLFNIGTNPPPVPSNNSNSAPAVDLFGNSDDLFQTPMAPTASQTSSQKPAAAPTDNLLGDLLSPSQPASAANQPAKSASEQLVDDMLSQLGGAKQNDVTQPKPQQQQQARPNYNSSFFKEPKKPPGGGLGSFPSKPPSTATFDDLLNSQGFNTSATQQSQSNRPIGQLRKEEEMKQMDPETAAVFEWAHGKERNLRALLCSLHSVIWEGSRWAKCGMHQLVTHADVKKMYRKACLAVHPDKQMGSDNENISKMIFTELNDAWAKFQEEESP